MRTSSAGFTLIELMTVISIMVMLVGISLVLPGGQLEAGARVAAGASTLNADAAHAAYVRRHGVAPRDAAALEADGLLEPGVREPSDCRSNCPHAPEVKP